MSLKATSGLIHRLQRSSFVRSVAVLATGSAISQVIPVIALPLISRLYDPADFGVAALFLSISSIVGVGATLRYEHAIVLPKDSGTANRITFLAVALALAFSFLLLCLVVVTKEKGWEPGWASQLGVWLYFLPLGALIIALDNTALSLATRAKQFRRIAEAGVTQSATVTGIRVVAGFFNSGVTGLVGSALTGAIARLAYLWLPQKENIRKHVYVDKPGKIRSLMYEYRQFPYYSLPTGLLRGFNQNLPVFALAIVFDPAIVGLYSIGNRLLMMPVLLFTESVRRTYLQKAAEYVNQEKSLRQPLLKATGGLALIGLLVFLPAMLFGDALFALVLGEKWIDAGKFAQILSPYLFFLFIQGPSGATFVVLQKQHILMKLQFVITLLITGVFVVAFVYSLEPKTTLGIFSAAASVMSIIVVGVAISLSATHTTRD